MKIYSSKKIINSKELWWFLLNNNRGESNNGLMYAKSLSSTYKNIFIQIRGSNPVAEQLSGLNLLIHYIQIKATCIYVHGRANIIYLIIRYFFIFIF